MSYPFHPIADEYPMMSAHDLGRLEQVMIQHGYDPRFPIVLYEGKILDGRNRQVAATNAKVKPKYVEFNGTEEEARQFAQHANEERRHLEREWLQKRRTERIERVAKRRNEGASTRQIAKEEGVSQPQIIADIKEAGDKGLIPESVNQTLSGDKGLSPESVNQTVTGRDGRKQSAKKKRKPAAKAEPQEPEQVDEKKPEGVPPAEQQADSEADPQETTLTGLQGLKDSLGLSVPESLVDVFDPHFESLRQKCLTLCRQLRDTLHDYAASPAGTQLRQRLSQEGRTDETLRYRSRDLKTLMGLIEHWSPYASVCPYCNTKGSKQNCGVCYGTGWVCQDAWEGSPQDYRDAIMGVATCD